MGLIAPSQIEGCWWVSDECLATLWISLFICKTSIHKKNNGGKLSLTTVNTYFIKLPHVASSLRSP